MGKAFVVIFAIVTFLVVPISIFYIADDNTPPNFSLDLQGRFYDWEFGELQEKGFRFFKFESGGKVIFTPGAWNSAYTEEVSMGIMPTGTFMMILWYVSSGMMLVGIVLAFFKPRLSGIFFIIAFLADGLQSLVWYFGMKASLPTDRAFFPIPVGSLFLLALAIIAFTTKKKESYYYSPGYSYGYGRR
ncbi:MAG: hypothetical protein U9O98_03080 [Asgard group archaeon]|nr:hypothetical protein [Asgard group archaeon]